jgi:hypothetical protein
LRCAPFLAGLRITPTSSRKKPAKAFDLKMAAELMEHLARLTKKLTRPAEFLKSKAE